MTPIVFGLAMLLLIGTPIGIAFALVVLLNVETFDLWLDSLGSVPYDSVSELPAAGDPAVPAGRRGHEPGIG